MSESDIWTYLYISLAFTTFIGDKEISGNDIQPITIRLEDVLAIVKTAYHLWGKSKSRRKKWQIHQRQQWPANPNSRQQWLKFSKGRRQWLKYSKGRQQWLKYSNGRRQWPANPNGSRQWQNQSKSVLIFRGCLFSHFYSIVTTFLSFWVLNVSVLDCAVRCASR